MFDFFSSESADAIPIRRVNAETLPAWLEANPRSREWIAATGFKAEAGTFALLPGDDGRPSAVIAAPADGEPIWAYASLPMALAEGRYRIDADDDARSATEAALGWALASYAFTTYRNAKRAPATLVWPGRADRDEVERLARAVFLARDLINTPAEDMGLRSSQTPRARSRAAAARRRA